MLQINHSNPILYYKLDPGEWGSSSAATASNSISRVASHESSNLQRFESKANKEGCYIVDKDLYLNLVKQGSYLAAISGHSSVATYCPKKDKTERIKSGIGSKINARITKYTYDEFKLKTMLKAVKSNSLKSIYKNDLKKIESRKLELQQKKMRIYTQITLLLAQNIKFDPSMIDISV